MAWNETDRRDRFSEELLESENDRLVESVASKVSSLKHIAIDLRSEAKDQVTILDDSGGLFETMGTMLGGSFKKVQNMRRTRAMSCRHMCYFILFVMVFVFVVYLLIDKVVSR